MLELMKRRTIDLLVEQFWKRGYLTVSRKFGTYLPEPSKIGRFDVDIVAKYKNNYALGVTLTNEDIDDNLIIDRLNFLATRQTKYTNKKVLLFIGVPSGLFANAKIIVEKLEPEARKNIRLFPISEKAAVQRRSSREKGNVLFS
ncbi:MAG: hypothetical protein P4L45_01560 [Ignavibacteriaceae bacterium]|nr:hypothetical protein [Ignavibacteriaceae bacterium]